jgi:hypothetical protein
MPRVLSNALAASAADSKSTRAQHSRFSALTFLEYFGVMLTVSDLQEGDHILSRTVRKLNRACRFQALNDIRLFSIFSFLQCGPAVGRTRLRRRLQERRR